MEEGGKGECREGGSVCGGKEERKVRCGERGREGLREGGIEGSDEEVQEERK